MRYVKGTLRLLLGAAVAIATACGSSSNGNNAQPASDDAGAPGDDAMAAAPDGDDAAQGAEPPDDGPWPADHYPMPQFINLGGKVLASPKIITVTFVGNASRDALRAFDDQLGGSNWWKAVSQGYGIAPGTGGVYAELPDTVSNTTIDDTTQLQPMIQGWVASGALPAPDANTLYVIFFPASTSITLQGQMSCNAFGAYHNSTSITLEGGVWDAAYAVIPDCGNGMAEATADVSHEVAEAITDPHPETNPAWYGYDDAWFRVGGSTLGQGEVADVCQRARTITDAMGNVLSKAWVNAAAAASHDPCQPGPAGEIYYNTAVPTVVVDSGSIGNTYKSDGYVIVKRGSMVTLDAVIFSDARLPNDVTLSAGARSRGMLNPIGAGINVTLSPTSGHNGMHVTVTIAVDASAMAKDYPAVVRSTLTPAADGGAGTYNDWPLILRGQ
jgi:hypothetical protein